MEDIKNSFWDYTSLIIGNFWSIIFAGLTMMLLTRILDPAAYGSLMLFHMTCQFLILIIARWNNNAVLRYAREEFITTGKINATVWGRMLFIMPLFILSIVFLHINSERISVFIGFENNRLVYAIPFYCMALIMLDFIYNVARSISRIKIYSWSIGAERFIVLIGMLLVWAHLVNADIGSVISIYIAGAFITALAAFFFLKPSIWVPPVAEKKVIKKILIFSYPFILIAICMVGMGWIDSFFIRRYLTLESVGIYSLSYRLMSLVQMLSTFLATVIMPIIITYYAKDRMDSIRKYATNVMPKIIFLWSLFLAFSMCAAECSFPLLFSSEFQAAIAPLRFLMASLSFFVIFSLNSPIIQTLEVVNKVQLGFLLSLGLNITGDIVLIPRIGIIGAAYSTGFAFFVLAAWYAVITSKELGLRWGFKNAVYMLPAWFVIPGLIIFSEHMIWKIAWTGALLVISVLVARKTGLFSKKDIDIINGIDMPIPVKRITAGFLNILTV